MIQMISGFFSIFANRSVSSIFSVSSSREYRRWIHIPQSELIDELKSAKHMVHDNFDSSDLDEGSSSSSFSSAIFKQQKSGFEAEINKEKSQLDYLVSDEDESDVVVKHQNLIKQMRLELKNSRIGVLSTISEESETVEEYFKPIDFDTKIDKKDVLLQIQMFHRTYSEKMKKLDILNYQTLQAISLVQMKDCESEFSAKTTTKTDFCLPTTWRCNIRKVHHDSVQIPIKKHDHVLELVYIGQLCLSWEILRWLSEKTRELIGSNSKMTHSYNRAVEGFQMFQVMLQRFMEDERYRSDRVHNYTNSRNMINNLLHVPNIKDDSLNLMREQANTNDVITIMGLLENIVNSKAIFKDFMNTDSKKVQGLISLNEENLDLFIDVMTTLLKKERRMKEYNKKGKSFNVKKMKKKKFVEDEVFLTCEIELKLVGRVLKMSRLTRDQLIWCKKKLENINFVGEEVKLEQSFSLFPC